MASRAFCLHSSAFLFLSAASCSFRAFVSSVLEEIVYFEYIYSMYWITDNKSINLTSGQLDSCCLLEVVGVAGVDVSVALTQPKGRGQIFMLDLQGFLQLLTICTLNFSNVTSLLHNGL